MFLNQSPTNQSKKMNTPKKPTGLIFAMQEEQAGLAQILSNQTCIRLANKDFLVGDLWGHPVVCVLSGIGKVAAASTTSLLLSHFSAEQIVLTGVAGACDSSLRVGDIVIADQLVQHDMDASPLFPRFEIPLTGKTYFATHPKLREQLRKASETFIQNDLSASISKLDREQFQLNRIALHEGLIASGDQFISDREKLNQLKQALPTLLAVEMEGAAIAQVCHDFQRPFAIVRTISDGANDEAHLDFPAFVKTVAAPYTLGILRNYFLNL